MTAHQANLDPIVPAIAERHQIVEERMAQTRNELMAGRDTDVVNFDLMELEMQLNGRVFEAIEAAWRSGNYTRLGEDIQREVNQSIDRLIQRQTERLTGPNVH